MLDAAGGVQDSITCAGAHHAAQALAAFLTGPAGLRPGDRAVLVYPPGAPSWPRTAWALACVGAGRASGAPRGAAAEPAPALV